MEDPDYHARLLDYVRRYRADPRAEPPVRREQTLRVDERFRAAERTFATLPGFLRYCGRLPTGVGALLPTDGEPAGEICSLYTLTRFLGEGIGCDLVRFACARAAAAGLAYVYACTTSARVEGFFHRLDFRTVSPAEIPATKWERYPPDRRDRVICVRHDLARA